MSPCHSVCFTGAKSFLPLYLSTVAQYTLFLCLSFLPTVTSWPNIRPHNSKEYKCERPEKSAAEFCRISQRAEKGLIFQKFIFLHFLSPTIVHVKIPIYETFLPTYALKVVFLITKCSHKEKIFAEVPTFFHPRPDFCAGLAEKFRQELAINVNPACLSAGVKCVRCD